MDGEVVIGVGLNTKSFDKQINYIEKRMEEIEHLLKQADLGYDVGDTAKLEAEYEKLSNQLITLNEKKQKAFANSEVIKKFNTDLQTTKDKMKELDNSLDNVSQKKDFSTVNQQLNNVGNGVEGVIKKITRWGLALFGIRSMYNFIRGSMSTLSGYNEQMATDVEYIRFALATTLQPVIEKIIQLAYTLLQYIGYIAKAWFGVNIFANATTKAFQSNNKALKDSNKQAKQLQKTLAGFDEMNLLQDNTDTGGKDTSTGGGGVTTPSIDLSELKEFDSSIIGTWLDKLRDFLLKGFDGIVKNIKKVMKDLGFSQDLIDAFSFWIDGVRKMFKGFLDFVIGILKTIVGLFTGNTELLKEGVKQAFNGIITFLKGALQMWIGQITMGVALAGQILKTLVTFIKNNIINPIVNIFSGLWNGVINGVRWAVNNIKNFFNSIPSFFSGIVNRITGFFRNLGYSAGNVIAGAFRSVVNAVMRTIENVLNSPIRTINSLISTINKISPVKIGRLSTFRLPRLAKGGIVNMPSRGVPIGGAIVGERGQEGVIPLTDSQQMALLGEAIGRYITVNANITNTMNGRVISREIQRVQNNSNFAMNR